MRVLLAVALAIFAVAGKTVAGAADLQFRRSSYEYGNYAAAGARAGQLVIDQFEPGVALRSYWLAPWRNHHYFPATGKRPRIGRLEHLSAHSTVRPAESFHRYWSTSSAFAPEQPSAVLREFDSVQPPYAEPPARNGYRNPGAVKP